ncbi:glycoside hydrolase family 5 protein [Phytoactinopolyspora endophytica]|uniref:glycoside hydrolase family 5 protein n=1 Tax=Phytoactinopolyspora endophytica TaxID=1642495 RepID=UPI00197B434F|nr:glycoside hydrolase family 5 protein [Phytoactinopolyspora endophytica]
MTDNTAPEISRRRLLGTAGVVTAGVAAGVAAPSIFRAPRAAADPGDGTFYVGANLAGLEFSPWKMPGTPHFDYAVPTPEELDYMNSRNLTVIRLPFRWQRVQHALNGPLDAEYLGFITDVVDYAGTQGMKIILDVHDYGKYGDDKIGAGVVTSQDFADLWTRLATAVVGKPGLGGYDLMNEPQNMPSPDAWPDAAQAAIDAIRTVDTSTPIIVEGDNWASAASWLEYNSDLILNDPNDNLIYSAHNYFDRDSSGTHYDWDEEVAAGDTLQDPPGPLTTDIGAQRLEDYVGWLNQHGMRGLVGEVGASNRDPEWLETLDKMLAYCEDNGVGVTYWSGGAWFENYVMGITPQRDGRNTVQMAVLDKYTGAPAPDVYYLSGPNGGCAEESSAPFIVDYRGYIEQPIRVYPTDIGGGGQFEPASVKLSPGFNGLATFRYTPPPGSADYSIGGINRSGLTDPAPLEFSTRPEVDWETEAISVIGLNQVVPAFVGGAITLERASDSVQENFAFGADGSLDEAAITSWADGSKVLVVTVTDQGPEGRDAGKVTTENHNGEDETQLDSSPADYPELVTGGLNGGPVLRLHKSRMDAVAPIRALPGFTCFVVCKPTSEANMQRLLSWHFTDTNLITNSSGNWQTSREGEMPMGIDASAWHIYAVRHQGGYSRTTWRDGELIASKGTNFEKIRFRHRSHVNIGYFRWWPDVHYDGDFWGFLPFSVALTDAQMRTVWNQLSDVTGIPVSVECGSSGPSSAVSTFSPAASSGLPEAAVPVDSPARLR